MPHVASLPIIEAEEYKLMVDTGCLVGHPLVYAVGYPDPPQNINVLDQVVTMNENPWGNAWHYNDHQPMFDNECVGEGQEFDFILTGGWYLNKTISFTGGTVKVEPNNTVCSPNIFVRERYPIITVGRENFLFDSGIPFSTKFANLPAEGDLDDYQLCFSPLAGGVLKIKTQQDDEGLLWLTGWKKSNPQRRGDLQGLAGMMRQAVGNDIVGCIGSDYLLQHDLTIAY